MGDLRNVLTVLTGMIPQADTFVSESDSINVLKCGEHVASVWFDYDQNSFDWYLGVIDGDSYQDEDIIISYMKRGDKNGYRWLFPETAEILPTKKKMIIKRNITVSYSLTAMIRCIIDNETLKEINESFKKFDFNSLY